MQPEQDSFERYDCDNCGYGSNNLVAAVRHAETHGHNISDTGEEWEANE